MKKRVLGLQLFSTVFINPDIYLNQIWQMSFDCCLAHFNLEVIFKNICADKTIQFRSCDKMSDYDVIIDDVTKTCFHFLLNLIVKVMSLERS